MRLEVGGLRRLSSTVNPLQTSNLHRSPEAPILSRSPLCSFPLLSSSIRSACGRCVLLFCEFRSSLRHRRVFVCGTPHLTSPFHTGILGRCFDTARTLFYADALSPPQYFTARRLRLLPFETVSENACFGVGARAILECNQSVQETPATPQVSRMERHTSQTA